MLPMKNIKVCNTKSIVAYLVLSTIITSFTFSSCDTQPKFPATLMEMNKPAYLLRDSAFWNRNESNHFVYFSSKKVGDDFIKDIIQNQETNIIHIAAIMNLKEVDKLPKIKLWIFNSDHEKYLKTQVKSNAHTLTEYWSTYYNKNNATGAHEIAHLLSQHFWGYLKSKKYNFLMEEGFAFYVDETRFFKFEFYKKAKSILANAKYSISTIIKDNNNNEDYEDKATVCGAFDKYLITNFGIEKFAVLWKNIDNENIFNSTYNKSLSNLESDFYKFLETIES